MKISFKIKKVLSFILAFSIILSMVPSFSLIASATTYTIFDGDISISDSLNNSGFVSKQS